jgi:hypothetical protein
MIMSPPNRETSADRFTIIPLIIAAIVWLLTFMPLVYDIGGIFLDPSLLPGLVIWPFAVIA